jgi:hypothetical protein
MNSRRLKESRQGRARGATGIQSGYADRGPSLRLAQVAGRGEQKGRALNRGGGRNGNRGERKIAGGGEFNTACEQHDRAPVLG